MNCEHAQEALIAEVSGRAGQGWARAHAATCAECRDALAAVTALREDARLPVPTPRPEAFERAVDAALQRRASAEPRSRGGFWAGLGLGAALAASLAVAMIRIMTPSAGTDGSAATPRIALMANESRDVSIALMSPDALENAEIHVLVTGSIGLGGFEGQRELRWRTRLDAGMNRLTLPVVAIGDGGGQLLVEVSHGDKRRRFLVDVETALAEEGA